MSDAGGRERQWARLEELRQKVQPTPDEWREVVALRDELLPLPADWREAKR